VVLRKALVKINTIRWPKLKTPSMWLNSIQIWGCTEYGSIWSIFKGHCSVRAQYHIRAEAPITTDRWRDICQSQIYITTDRQSASPSWCQAPNWDPRTIFSVLSLIIFLDSCGFVDVGRPLWREFGSVLYSFCRESPAQPFSDLSPTGLTSIFYCLYFWDRDISSGLSHTSTDRIRRILKYSGNVVNIRKHE
jgi:hypothetical protein